jgi:hypothetical protein
MYRFAVRSLRLFGPPRRGSAQVARQRLRYHLRQHSQAAAPARPDAVRRLPVSAAPAEPHGALLRALLEQEIA